MMKSFLISNCFLFWTTQMPIDENLSLPRLERGFSHGESKMTILCFSLLFLYLPNQK